MRVLIQLFLLLTMLISAQQLDPKFNIWPNNAVRCAIEKDGIIYIGGNFTGVGKGQPYFGSVDIQGNWIKGWPSANNVVYAIVADGTGGWFVGGTFTKIGGQSISYLARLNPDRSVDAGFSKTLNSNVLAMKVHGGVLYLGGNFTSVSGTTRNRLAAIDIATGSLTSWNPNVNGSVTALAVSANGDTIYAGGSFTTVNTSITRNYLASFNTSGTVTSWNPNAGGSVTTMILSGYTIFAGGTFTTVNGGTARNRLAAFDASTGTATSWNPNAGSTVNTLAASSDGNTIYAGGTFTTVNGGTTRNRLAAFDASAGTATSWNPNADNSVRVLALSNDGSTVFAGGDFTTVNGASHKYLVSINATSGNPLTWSDYYPSSYVYSIALNSDSLLIGGSFYQIETPRGRLASINASTGELTSWNPNLNNSCYAMISVGSTIYTGGSFTTVNGGTTRNYIAAFDPSTGTATSWNPSANGTLNTLAASEDGNTIYAGGTFTTIGGQPRTGIVAILTSDATVTAWNPGADGNVFKIAVGSTSVFACGAFTTIGGQTRSKLASIDPSTGLATTWDPNMNAAVNTMVLDGTTLYVGGSFTKVSNGAVTRNYLAAYNTLTGTVLDWDPNAGAAVNSLAVSPTYVYAGGNFTTVNTPSVTRNRVAAFDKTTGAASANFDPNAGSTPYAIIPSISLVRVLIFGGFTTMGGVDARYMAVTHNPDDPALPVELTSFSAKMINGKVNLFWETKTEIDNHGFEVERCVAGTSWEKLGFVEGHGTSNSPRYYSFIDGEKPLGKTSYRLKQIDNDGTIEYSHTVEISGELPSVVTLEQNFPNPYNPVTVIRYALPARGSAIADNVVLKVYDVAGTEVATLVNQKMEAGNHSVVFNAASAGLPSGVYLYRLTVTAADGRQFTQTRKMLLMK